MTRLSALFGRLFDALAVVAALMLFAMVMLTTADIVLRNVARIGFPWANEVAWQSVIKRSPEAGAKLRQLAGN
jgi:TRAP-type C4-dicarboxylate transport system permease small subunit